MNPLVTVVVPARNEADHIEACVRSILSQPITGGLELFVVDGRSEDATAALARAAGATVIDNPLRTIPAALNLGLAAACGSVIVRFDAHAEMPPGYLSACLEALEAERAVNVGGWRQVRASGPWGDAVAHALRSPWGVGNARIWRPPARGARRLDVETVPLGCFPTEALLSVGGWNEGFEANEDFELNHRLRRQGGRVVFDPAIWSVYRPRENLTEIVRQYWRYGRWKAVMLRTAPSSIRVRQLAPPALVIAVGAAIAPSRVTRLARIVLGLYALGIAAVGPRASGGWRTPVVITAMHVCWGAGLLAGFVRRPRPQATAATGEPAGLPGRASRAAST